MKAELRNRRQGFWKVVHRAFAEFLKLPTLIVAGFLLSMRRGPVTERYGSWDRYIF